MTSAQAAALKKYQDNLPMTDAERAALAEYQASVEQFRNTDPAQFHTTGDLTPQALGDTALADVRTDPKYKEHELAALRELEQQSRDGFTAADRADIARAEQQANRANRGRIGAIKQSMAARGAGGTGMELVAQMQSAQDANEMEALRALEREGNMMDRKHQATMDLGRMSGGMQARDYQQAADRARARDAIAQFNVSNSNSAQAASLANRQNVANMNVNATNQHARDVMGAGQGAAQFAYGAAGANRDRALGGAQLEYNAATEDENRRLLAEQEKQRQKAAKNQALGQGIGAAGGAIVGGFFGSAAGPAGTYLGASAGGAAGGALGGGIGSYLSDKRAKQDVKPENDLNIEAFLATLEPKSYTYKGDTKPRHGVLAQDLEKSVIGRDMVTDGPDGLKHVSVPDAISALLSAVAHLNKKMKG